MKKYDLIDGQYAAALDLDFNVRNGPELMRDWIAEDYRRLKSELWLDFAHRRTDEFKFTVKGVDVVVTRRRDFKRNTECKHNVGVKVKRKHKLLPYPKLNLDQLAPAGPAVICFDRKGKNHIIGHIAGEGRWSMFEIASNLSVRQCHFANGGTELEIMGRMADILRHHLREFKDAVKFVQLDVGRIMYGNPGDCMNVVAIDSTYSVTHEWGEFNNRGDYGDWPHLMESIGMFSKVK